MLILRPAKKKKMTHRCKTLTQVQRKCSNLLDPDFEYEDPGRRMPSSNSKTKNDILTVSSKMITLKFCMLTSVVQKY